MFHRIALGLLACGLFAVLDARVPRPMPVEGITLPSGGSLKLAQYTGKVVTVLLFSTHCTECVDSVELLSKLHKQWASRGLQAVGVAVNMDAPEETKGFIERYRPSFPIGFMGQQGFIKLADLKPGERPFVPIFMFIDHRGTVRFQYFGNEAIMADQAKATTGIIDSLLKSRNNGK